MRLQIASYNVLEYYTRLNQEHNFGRISVGGINVNLGEMFKSAMNENALPMGYTEKAVAQVSLQVQKWLIYWIVLSLLTLTETIASFIIPFYQFFKLPLILYLLSPMLMNSSKLAVSAIVASDKPPTIDNDADWKQFQEQGCGFVYFKLIKPFLDGEVDAIMKYIPLDKLKHLTSTIPINLTTLSWALKIAMFKMSSNRSMDESIADSVSSRGVDSEVKSKSPVQQGAVGGVGGAATSFYEEFDMVDKPLETDSNLRLRDPKPKPENKRWLW
ncbi:uncharacterized protein KQ657_004972 [Scheffersomyces spartinae]|uniref:Protein YOP1 n=1 Tax=Scheffersomyces spartinae TaxID=45513 RepID=A0A9P8AJL9_9ASCO|nr:uncharacterized protein KQ657_004972 [Scheffersomyces spartinae]KAG7194252.1 hypothetical protein KQ657_004972 [Scheffersomyces spartinae]